jgi:transcription antitermination factor NusG
MIVTVESCIEQLPWYALMTRYRYERRIELGLITEGFEAFVPVRCELRRWSDRTVRIEQPLFPGYTFVRTGRVARDLARILRLAGVVRFVMAGATPAEVPDEDIRSVRALVRSQVHCEPAEYPAFGSKVILHGGCLEGVQGIVTAQTKHGEITVCVGQIQRALKFQLGSGYWMERLTEAGSSVPNERDIPKLTSCHRSPVQCTASHR